MTSPASATRMGGAASKAGYDRNSVRTGDVPLLAAEGRHQQENEPGRKQEDTQHEHYGVFLGRVSGRR